jgi:hypothetical protein
VSHQDYIKNLDEDQLLSLIEHAQAKIRLKESEGWVEVWVAGTSDLNLYWVAKDDYATAIEALHAIGLEYLRKGDPIELELISMRYRPSEVADLLIDSSVKLMRLRAQ